jgi:hypothetical protein
LTLGGGTGIAKRSDQWFFSPRADQLCLRSSCANTSACSLRDAAYAGVHARPAALRSDCCHATGCPFEYSDPWPGPSERFGLPPRRLVRLLPPAVSRHFRYQRRRVSTPGSAMNSWHRQLMGLFGAGDLTGPGSWAIQETGSSAPTACRSWAIRIAQQRSTCGAWPALRTCHGNVRGAGLRPPLTERDTAVLAPGQLPCGGWVRDSRQREGGDTSRP